LTQENIYDKMFLVIICAMCLIVKGYNIAGEMASDILTVASEDGCINYTTLDTMMQGFKRNYETKDPSAGEEGGVSYEDAHGHDKYFMFF
jgi:hypothetical protein